MPMLTVASSPDAPANPEIVVPYITAWSAEQNLPCQVVERPGCGIGYVDETPIDRDGQGVLWDRVMSRPRQGRPEFGMVHPLRQRRAMRRLLCQVCAGPADRTADGVLWLLKDHRGDWAGWPEGMAVSEPPVCRPCVRLSGRLCPALRKGAAAVRVRDFPIVGVRGTVYQSDGMFLVAAMDEIVAFDAPAVQWVRAVNLLRELHDCVVVSVGDMDDGDD